MSEQIMKPVVVDTTRSPFAKLRPISVSQVTLTDSFWAPRIEVNRDLTIPAQYKSLVETSSLENFRWAAGVSDKPFKGMVFTDSDVHKWLEAASWSLASHPDPELDRLCDGVIELIGSAQDQDGYLDSYFSHARKSERWSNMRDLHELYCAGHYIQAAVAHYRATSKESALTIARRLADNICRVFGSGDGQRELTDGHEEIEMALVELYRATGEERYLQHAQFFVDVRGRGVLGANPSGTFGSSYFQDHIPLREMQAITGHAVRAVYYNCGAADLYAEGGDTQILDSLHTLWDNMTKRRMYVSGGIGSRWEGEAFGEDYELPNARAYTETCAAIGSVMWCWRMLQIEGDARYSDLIEHTLYNAVLPGLSLDGRRYFYQNPLADGGGHRREEWFGCACCPPNIARLLASLSGYFYSQSLDEGRETIWAHLYAASEARFQVRGEEVLLRQSTDYPWDGNIALVIELQRPLEFALKLRIPGWAEGASISLNGQRLSAARCGEYVEIYREWRSGDRIEISLPMAVRRLRSHPKVLENSGRVALMRGPILYCLEGVDHPGTDLSSIELPSQAELISNYERGLLGGVATLSAAGVVGGQDEELWSDRLYSDAESTSQAGRSAVAIKAVPYFAWANRDAGQMQVWIKSD